MFGSDGQKTLMDDIDEYYLVCVDKRLPVLEADAARAMMDQSLPMNSRTCTHNRGIRGNGELEVRECVFGGGGRRGRRGLLDV